jgi:trehalose-6-phosphatase
MPPSGPRADQSQPPACTEACTSRSRHLLLDFDGPVCNIFDGHRASAIAARLAKLITSHGTQPPEDIAQSGHPMAVFV